MRARPEKITFLLDSASDGELVISSGMSAAYPVHCHVSTITLGLVRRGKVCLERGDAREWCSAGETFIIYPYQAHRLFAPSPYSLICLCVSKRHSISDRRKMAAGMLNRAVRAGYLSGNEGEALCAAVRHMPRSSFELCGESDSLAALKESLENNPEQAWALSDMATAVHLDKHHLARKFRNRYGLPPRHFLIQNRIRKAKRACRQTSNLTRAALEAGFYDQSHLIRHFKKALALTPQQYADAVNWL